MDRIDKVGGIILRDCKILVVRKMTKDNRQEFIIPGGKREGNETDIQTLERELKEELQVQLVDAVYFGSFDDVAIFENIPIHMEVYVASVEGEPECDSEIKDIVWIDKDYHDRGIELGSILGIYVIPELIRLGLM